MDDNPFVAALDNLLARLLVADCARRLPSDIIRVVVFKLIVNSTAAPLRDGSHMTLPFTKVHRKTLSSFLNY
jgi:hypothetical protein